MGAVDDGLTFENYMRPSQSLSVSSLLCLLVTTGCATRCRSDSFREDLAENGCNDTIIPHRLNRLEAVRAASQLCSSRCLAVAESALDLCEVGSTPRARWSFGMLEPLRVTWRAVQAVRICRNSSLVREPASSSSSNTVPSASSASPQVCNHVFEKAQKELKTSSCLSSVVHGYEDSWEIIVDSFEFCSACGGTTLSSIAQQARGCLQLDALQLGGLNDTALNESLHVVQLFISAVQLCSASVPSPADGMDGRSVNSDRTETRALANETRRWPTTRDAFSSRHQLRLSMTMSLVALGTGMLAFALCMLSSHWHIITRQTVYEVLNSTPAQLQHF